MVQSPQISVYYDLSACEMLAGQYYQDDSFPCSSQTGQWHRQHGEEAVTRWLQRAATDGFLDTSGHGLAQLLIALSHLIDLADSEQIWNLAAVVMDKALDSFQGVYGASQPNSHFAPARSGYVSPLAGIARLLWGIGAWNHHLAAPVSLACCQGYEQPPVIAALASETHAAGMWATERHPIGGESGEERENLTPRTLHKAIYKTPDYLLCSTQDFQPGQQLGRAELAGNPGRRRDRVCQPSGRRFAMAGCCHASPSIMIS